VRKAATRFSALALGVSAALAGASPLLISTPAEAGISIGIGVSVNIAPPALPVYEQPELPAYGYIWVPGYWAWADGGYYWVPGTWVLPPAVGLLWTPGYWGWSEGVYVFHEGYWGPHVGFYGGINYGFGYTGNGYEGGRWGNGGFYYNQSVNRLGGVHVTNVYNQTVINNVTVNHASYNGGTGGVAARPTPQEASYAQQQHTPPVAAQQQHARMAAQNSALRFATNHGNPPIAATAKPANFTGAGVVAARGAPAPEAAAAQHPNPVHANPAAANNGAMRSANFAPHPNAASAAAEHHAATPEGGVTHAPARQPVERPQPEERPTAVPKQAYRPAAARQQAPHASPQPAYHPAARPAPAAHPAPHPAPKPQPRPHNDQDHGG
jgi:hypothetical protein